MQKEMALAIIMLGSCGLSMGQDISDRCYFDMDADAITPDIAIYHNNQINIFATHQFRCAALTKAYKEKFGNNVDVDLTKAIELVLDADDTTVLLQDAIDTLLNVMDLRFKI